jgi:phospholipid transport system substrate-binding protein
MFSRRSLILAAVAGGLLCATVPQAHAQSFEGAKEFVRKLSRDAIDVMTAKEVNDGDRRERFRALFIGSVDLPLISKFALGRYWKPATPEQKQDFVKLFEDMLVLTWSTRFKDAANTVTLEVLEAKPDVDNGLLVESRIVREKQEPVSVIWRLRNTDGGFRIIDLVIEGTSMIFTYRDEYASVITQNGGNVQALIDLLRKKVAQLSGTAAAN